MVICKNLKHIHKFDASVLTMGLLDGIHLGHTEIIADLIKIAKEKNLPSVVITFDPHPKSILSPNKKPLQFLLNTKNKLEYFKKEGIDYVWIIPFSKEFAKVSAGEFLQKYISDYFNPYEIIIGYDHHFGFNREGDELYLHKYKTKYGYILTVKDPICYIDSPISSTRIRSYLKSGDIDKANECLGWQYEFPGIIVEGQGIGTSLGFPTANIMPKYSNQLIPAHGVYCVNTIIDNINYRGMCNIGLRPTFYNNGKEVIEVHLFSDDDLNLYRKDITIKFNKYIREEKKYRKNSELIEQLKIDRQICIAQ